ACAHYTLMRLRENALDEQDLKYFDSALDNLNCDCAVVGCFLYGEKDSPYYDEKKAYYCYAITEQYGYAQAHKILKKNYAKRHGMIDEYDSIILSHRLQRWAASLTDRYSAFNVEVSPAEFLDVIDYKHAYFVKTRLEQVNGRQTEQEIVYVAYLRDKDSDGYLERLSANLIDEFEVIAEKRNIGSGEIYVKGTRKFRYGDAKPMRKAKRDTVDKVSDEEINIKISDAGRLEGNVCPDCGGALDENGVCAFCGNARGESDEIKIRRAKNVEALLCTQCGSPVQLDSNGKTAYCASCGTTFAVKGNALNYDVSGIDYATIQADMPQGSELPDVKFVRARIVDGKITAVMPETFDVMSDEMRRIKYPVNTPRYIYTTPDSTVNLNVNFSGSLKDEDVFAFGKQMLSVLKNTFRSGKFGEAKLIKSNKNIYFINFITAAIDQPIY
ncbi:MAG: hypothetical protein K2I78_03565, partial [Clostridia bacterium]|nr:hypothetical protein [Clostridia bacterium]